MSGWMRINVKVWNSFDWIWFEEIIIEMVIVKD